MSRFLTNDKLLCVPSPQVQMRFALQRKRVLMLTLVRGWQESSETLRHTLLAFLPRIRGWDQDVQVHQTPLPNSRTVPSARVTSTLDNLLLGGRLYTVSAAELVQYFPPILKFVATLPCET